MNYAAFLETKQIRFDSDGLDPQPMNDALFPFQRHIVDWALRKGRACVFADCGLGKTVMQLEWAQQVPGRVLIIAPLAVTYETRQEGERFGFDLDDIDITNYERLHRYDLDEYAGVVLDESSILKSYGGKVSAGIIEATASHRYKLACTATPAPNDHVELGTHAEFVGSMSRAEMLALYFINDQATSQSWRLKGHARREFWRWVRSWATMVTHPRDLGFSQDGYDLPPLETHTHFVDAGYVQDGVLIPGSVKADINERRAMRRESITDRVSRVAELVAAEPDEQWVVWCDLNAESSSAARAIDGAVEVRGSDRPEVKADRMLGFAHGDVRCLVTKPSIAGHGMNWQCCARVVFIGLSDSYEAFYQAVRRCWRFGQTRPVEVHIVVSKAERMVADNVLRKEAQHQEMQAAMIEEVACA